MRQNQPILNCNNNSIILGSVTAAIAAAIFLLPPPPYWYGSLARAKPPVDVTTGYQQSEPANGLMWVGVRGIDCQSWHQTFQQRFAANPAGSSAEMALKSLNVATTLSAEPPVGRHFRHKNRFCNCRFRRFRRMFRFIRLSAFDTNRSNA